MQKYVLDGVIYVCICRWKGIVIHFNNCFFQLSKSEMHSYYRTTTLLAHVLVYGRKKCTWQLARHDNMKIEVCTRSYLLVYYRMSHHCHNNLYTYVYAVLKYIFILRAALHPDLWEETVPEFNVWILFLQ